VLVSDNGASGEGGPNGSVNENKFFNGVPDDIDRPVRRRAPGACPGDTGHLRSVLPSKALAPTLSRGELRIPRRNGG
jgi:hypothetical protein